MNWQNAYLNFKSNFSLDSLAANQNRHKAFELFLKKGLPSKKEEAWKYTSLNKFNSVEWSENTANEFALTHEQLQEVSKNLNPLLFNIVLVNGALNRTLSDDLSDKIIISEVDSQDIGETSDHVEALLLNLANSFLAKKISIRIAKNKFLNKPLQLIYVQTSSKTTYQSEKIEIIAEENAELCLLVHSMNLSKSGALNLKTNLTIKDNAKVKLIQLQNENLESYHFSQTEIQQHSNSYLQALVVSLGAVLTRNYLHLNLVGAHAESNVYGLSISSGEQHVDNYTYIQHSKGENKSVQHYKAILSDSSESVFRGRVRIEPNAQKADSSQLNNNLLLTQKAQANSIPQLEIYADDVKAGHGSTVGQLNKDEIFYFLSRGINQFEAAKMLSFGFAKELIYKIENESVQKHLIRYVNHKLEGMIKNV